MGPRGSTSQLRAQAGASFHRCSTGGCIWSVQNGGVLVLSVASLSPVKVAPWYVPLRSGAVSGHIHHPLTHCMHTTWFHEHAVQLP